MSLDLPIVQKTFKVEVGGQVAVDNSAFGLVTQPSVRLTCTQSTTLAVGGGLDVKLSLGESEEELANTTDEALHITAKGLVSATPVDGLAIDFEDALVTSWRWVDHQR